MRRGSPATSWAGARRWQTTRGLDGLFADIAGSGRGVARVGGDPPGPRVPQEPSHHRVPPRPGLGSEGSAAGRGGWGPRARQSGRAPRGLPSRRAPLRQVSGRGRPQPVGAPPRETPGEPRAEKLLPLFPAGDGRGKPDLDVKRTCKPPSALTKGITIGYESLMLSSAS